MEAVSHSTWQSIPKKGIENLNVRIPMRICYDHWRTGAYLQALQPRLSPAQPGRDRWGERHKAPCPADSSPSFPNSLITPLFLFFLHCSPSHFAGRTGRLTPPLPRRASLSLHLCSPTQMPFPHLSQGLLLFLLLSLSLSLFKFLFGPQRNFWGDGSMAGKELPNSSSVAERGVFSFLYLYSNLIILDSLK